METRPPRLIERIVERLLPSSCRDEILGDLHERYRSPAQYFLDAVSVLPFAIVCHLKRVFGQNPPLASATPGGLRQRWKSAHRIAWNINFVWLLAAFVLLMTGPFPISPNVQQSPGMRLILMVGVFASIVHGYARHRKGTPTRRSELHTLSINVAGDSYRDRLAAKTDGIRLWSSHFICCRNSRFSLGGVHVHFVMLLISLPLQILLIGWVKGKPLPPGISPAQVWIDLACVAALRLSWIFIQKINKRAERTMQQEMDALDAQEKG